MKSFWITFPLKRTVAEQSGLMAEQLEEWLTAKLTHLTSLFQGNGHVRVKIVDDLRFDVELSFVIEARTSLDVVDKFRDDIEKLSLFSRGFEIRESMSFKLCMPAIHGEMLEPFFVRVDPETGAYRDTED